MQNWTDVPWCSVSLSSLLLAVGYRGSSFLSGWQAWLSAVTSSRSWLQGVVVLYIASRFPVSSPELVTLTDSPFSEVALLKRPQNEFHAKDASVAARPLFACSEHLRDPGAGWITAPTPDSRHVNRQQIPCSPETARHHAPFTGLPSDLPWLAPSDPPPSQLRTSWPDISACRENILVIGPHSPS